MLSFRPGGAHHPACKSKIDQFQAIINPPQSVILAVGRIKERPVCEDGQVVLKPVFFLSLSCNHRVLDGAGGAAFLQEVVSLIEKPTRCTYLK
jgi:pyruvate dehydrogenase E2 component (dihydrolipoamide acetyltransferase)